MGTLNYDRIVDLYHKTKDSDDVLKVFYANDYPVPYKTLVLYPVQVDLFLFFHTFIDCLLLPHHTSGDIKAISMSYLQYVFYLSTEKQQYDKVAQLGELLLMVLRKPDSYIDEKGNEKPTIEFLLDKGQFIVEGKLFTGKDFDKIRKIILEQNDIEFPDETINPDLVKAYKDAERLRSKMNGIKMCDLEDQINIVSALTSYKREDVLAMTIRSFTRILERVDKIMDYKIKSLLSPYMDKKEQKKIVHYAQDTARTLRQRIDESLSDLNSVKQKVSG